MPAPIAAATPTRYAVSAVASLSRLSPPSTVITRRGSPSRRPTATAATASGGATMAPSTNALASDSSGRRRWAVMPTTNVVNSTRPNASEVIARMFALMLITEESSAAEYSSGGSTTSRMRSGSSW
jgi:hypothetical protein